MRSEKDKMLAGELYRFEGPELIADNRRATAWMERYNSAKGLTADERLGLLRELFAAAGAYTHIRPPFYCDYGYNIAMGAHVFVNFSCVILDVAKVSIGDKTQIGPFVQMLTADHPRDAAQRRAGFELGRPIAIGANVWIGGGAIILPGVTIGDDAVVGAGAVVTRDVPSGATVVGNPARPK
jgi:maltose O-acetyltransferase